MAAGSSDPGPDHVRLLVKVARMYHERGVRQPEIAAQLSMSQPRVSRLLKEAVERGVVRTVVVSPTASTPNWRRHWSSASRSGTPSWSRWRARERT